MPQMIFVNLPVADLPAATSFYQAVGATKDDRFSDATTSGMAFSDTICLMLLTHDRFRQFSPRPVADAKTANEVLLTLSADSRDAVDAMIGRAAAAGGRIDPSPVEDCGGFMYGRSFEDLDGHLWGIMWMDVDAFLKATAAAASAAPV